MHHNYHNSHIATLPDVAAFGIMDGVVDGLLCVNTIACTGHSTKKEQQYTLVLQEAEAVGVGLEKVPVVVLLLPLAVLVMVHQP